MRLAARVRGDAARTRADCAIRSCCAPRCRRSARPKASACVDVRRLGKRHRARARRRALPRAAPDDRRPPALARARAQSRRRGSRWRSSSSRRGALAFTEAGTKRRAVAALRARRGGAGRVRSRRARSVSACDAAAFSLARLRSENHTLKRALTDPRLFAGIGNAYSDEILHRARLSPLALTAKLGRRPKSRGCSPRRARCSPNGPSDCARRRRRVSREASRRFRPEMAVHGRFGKPCPVCGAPVQRIVYAENECNYCARCQTGGVDPRRPRAVAAAAQELAALDRRAGLSCTRGERDSARAAVAL